MFVAGELLGPQIASAKLVLYLSQWQARKAIQEGCSHHGKMKHLAVYEDYRIVRIGQYAIDLNYSEVCKSFYLRFPLLVATAVDFSETR